MDAAARERKDDPSAGNVEAAAKIDGNGGPLFRRCENKGCGAGDGGGGGSIRGNVATKFRDFKKWCAACRATVYRSQTCQREVRRRSHDRECGCAHSRENSAVAYLIVNRDAIGSKFADDEEAEKYEPF